LIGRITITLVIAMLAAWPGAVRPFLQAAHAETPVATGHYSSVAQWLFDLYLNQSIRLTVANAGQAHPRVTQVLSPQMSAFARVLDRHRAPFVEAMQQPLRGHFGELEIAALAARLARQPVDLDEAARTRLIAVDQEFRRNGQTVIRAMTHDLGLLVSEALAAAPPIKQN
jgi:hypothetical protein